MQSNELNLVDCETYAIFIKLHDFVVCVDRGCRNLNGHQIFGKDSVVIRTHSGANIIIPAKAFAMDYVITGVGLSVCLFVCYDDN